MINRTMIDRKRALRVAYSKSLNAPLSWEYAERGLDYAR